MKNLKANDIMMREVFMVGQLDSVLEQIKEAAAYAMEQDALSSLGFATEIQDADTKPRSFAELYTQAMNLSFLYGMLHIKKQVESVNKVMLADSRSFQVNFTEAEDFLASAVAIPKSEFEDLSADLKFRAFTIAHVSRADNITRIQEVYKSFLAKGGHKHELLASVSEILTGAGVKKENPAWLHTHFRVNTMSAYNAGRAKQIERSSGVRFLMYNAILDGHTTDLCKKLHGKIFPKNHPFWQKFMPPNHFNCRAIVTPLSEAQVKERGLKIEDNKTSAGTVYGDSEELKKQHQFTASPVARWDEIPESMAQRATNAKLWTKILDEYYKSLSPQYWQKKLAEMKKFTPSKKALEHIQSERGRTISVEQILEIVQSPDQVFLAVTNVDKKIVKSLNAIRWTNDKKGIMIAIRNGIRTAYEITKEEIQRRKAILGWKELK